MFHGDGSRNGSRTPSLPRGSAESHEEDGHSRSTVHATIFDYLISPSDEDTLATNPTFKSVHNITAMVRQCGDFACLDTKWLLEDMSDFESKFQTMAQTALGDYEGDDIQRDERLKFFRAIGLFVYATDMYKQTNDEEVKRTIKTISCETAEEFKINWDILPQIEKSAPRFLAWGACFGITILLFGIYRLPTS